MNKLEVFINRLKKIGIKVELFANYPWVYFQTINGKTVRERFMSEHGFTVGYTSVKPGGEFRFENLEEIFKIIRKYA